MAPPRILVVNHWHDDNRGDSAITASTVELIKDRYPGAPITVAGLFAASDPEHGRGFRHLRAAHPDLAFAGSMTMSAATAARLTGDRLPLLTFGAWTAGQVPPVLPLLRRQVPGRVRRELAGVGLVVLNGGSNIHDDPAMSSVLSAVRLLQVLYPAACAHLLGIPVVGVGHTIGAFTRAPARRVAAPILGKLAALGVRDDDSATVCGELGVPARRGHDTAFSLTPRHSERVERILAGLPHPGGRTLCISVRQHPSLGAAATARVNHAFAGAAGRLLEDGLIDQAVVVPHTLGPTPIEDDREVSRELHALLPASRAVYVEDDLHPQELAALYGTAVAMLAVRLHAAILAMTAGTPAVAVSYFGTKTAGAMASAGLPDAWLPYEGFGADVTAAKLRAVLSPGVRQELRRTVPALRAGLRADVAAWPEPLDRPVSLTAGTP